MNSVMIVMITAMAAIAGSLAQLFQFPMMATRIPVAIRKISVGAIYVLSFANCIWITFQSCLIHLG